MTTWKGVKTWGVGEALSANDMLTYINDNLEALKEPPTDNYECDESSDYTTTSTSFVDVDATNLNLTITTTGGDVMVGFTGAVQNTTVGKTVCFDIDMDGAREGGDDGITQICNGGTDIPVVQVGMVYLITGLDAGEHTFKLQWKVNGGTAKLFAGAGTSNYDVHPQFWVREV